MVNHRERILAEWAKEKENEKRYKNANLIELDLPIRYHRCLVSEDIVMKEDLCNWTEREIRRIPNLGAKGLQFVKEAMVKHGLKFKGQE
jgi:DNA-directed RNA polymerase alpha subunit